MPIIIKDIIDEIGLKVSELKGEINEISQKLILES